jgi:hypothetical protein
MVVLGGGAVSYDSGTPVVLKASLKGWSAREPRRLRSCVREIHRLSSDGVVFDPQQIVQGYLAHKKTPTPYDLNRALSVPACERSIH